MIAYRAWTPALADGLRSRSRPRPSAEPSAPVTASIAVSPTLDGLTLTGVVGIDMPLGLLADGWRDADALARRALGRRGVTVFAIPPRPVWQQPTYAEANRACRELTGKGLSAQTWGLRGKLLEADAYRREVARAALRGAPRARVRRPSGRAPRRQQAHRGRPGHSQGTPRPGRHHPAPQGRRARPRTTCSTPPPSPGPPAASPPAEAVTLTNPAQPADDGTEIAIRY